jgi:hypothetical protein
LITPQAFQACKPGAMCHNFVVERRGSLPMSVESHLSELVRRHQAIENTIAVEEAHPSTDDLKVHELKRKKLQLKDEIEKLKSETERVLTH